MYEITTRNQLRLFYRYASRHPDVSTSLIGGRMSHVKLGHGTIVGSVPDPGGKNGPKVEVLFGNPEAPQTVTGPKVLSLLFVLDKGLLARLAMPSVAADAFRSFSARAAQDPDATIREGNPSLPPRKKDWQRFAAIVKAHRIGSLYHFTDVRNLDSIRRHGGLYSRRQCGQRRIRIAAPGGDATSQRLDELHGLQNYVRLGFNPCLPMMYTAQRDGRINEVAVLSIDPSVIYLEPTLFSDLNANDRDAWLGPGIEAFGRINFGLAAGDCWRGQAQKRLFQAEVLVKGHVPLNLVRNL